jgi:hypothetical protein
MCSVPQCYILHQQSRTWEPFVKIASRAESICYIFGNWKKATVAAIASTM